jgi:prepilin-type N-terminal cleavage/methylation domain-containing protein
MKKMNKKAFTLIELLIVIAIIGILFIVLVSKVDFATDKAKATGVQTDFRSYQMAFETVAKENAGFTTFGWDQGDVNMDGVRNSYDEKDTNKNGKRDVDGVDGYSGTTEAEFTGRKVYGETFDGIYSLFGHKDDGTGNMVRDTEYSRDALSRLETAINANLDPKLHITISDKGVISMANGAQDPWKTEYEGYLLTTDTKDDRGAIVLYSLGANAELGSVAQLKDGVVTVTVKTVTENKFGDSKTKDGYAVAAGVSDSNKAGKDDYSLATVYTYKNGYGEVISSTTGFSNNQ